MTPIHKPSGIRDRVGSVSTRYPVGLFVAAVIGGAVGAWIHFIASTPNLAALLAIFILAPFVLTVGLLFIIGLVMLPFGRSRGGMAMIGMALTLGAGGYVGNLIGPDWRYPIETSAEVSVTLDAPISQTFSGSGGTCRTVENGDQITAVSSGPIIENGDELMILSLNLPRGESNGSASIYGYHTEGRLAGYSGLFNAPIDFATGGLRMTGSGSFSDLMPSERGERIGGPDGPTRISGSFSWTCSPLPED